MFRILYPLSMQCAMQQACWAYLILSRVKRVSPFTLLCVLAAYFCQVSLVWAPHASEWCIHKTKQKGGMGGKTR